MVAFIHVAMEKGHIRDLPKFKDLIVDLPEVLECYSVTGDFDYVIKVIARDLKSLSQFLMDTLMRLPGVTACAPASAWMRSSARARCRCRSDGAGPSEAGAARANEMLDQPSATTAGNVSLGSNRASRKGDGSRPAGPWTRRGHVRGAPCCWWEPLLALALAGVARAQQDPAIPAFKSVDSMEARVQGCATCHGQGGQGTSNDYFPRIAGKPAAYLYNQLVAFRDGKRVYPPMNYLVAYLPDAYLSEIAEHFAKQRPAFAAQAADHRAGCGRLARRHHRHLGRCQQADPRLHHVATAPASPAWSRASRASRACARRTSSRSSRAGAPATGRPPSPIA